MALHGSPFPQQTFEGRDRGRGALFAFDTAEKALIKSKNISGGFGYLPAGTILAENVSAATTGNKGKLVPYVLDNSAETNIDKQIGVSFLVASYASAATDLYVTLDDSYRFAVGDDIILGRDNSGTWDPHNGGAITAIDRTTFPHMAKITFTTQKTSADFTTANKACCWPEGGAATKHSTAKYILEAAVDTGVGENCKGAMAPVVLSNAILNKGVMPNYDAQAATDLGATVDGPHLVVK